MDSIVLHGQSRGIKLLQKALGVMADGIIGSQTVREANSQNDNELVEKIAHQRLKFMRSLKIYNSFGKGWERRVEIVKRECARVP